LLNVNVIVKDITLTFVNKNKLMLHEKYILQLYSTGTLTFGKLFIIYLHISHLHLQLNSQKQFCTDNSVYLIVQLGIFYSMLNKEIKLM